MGKRSTFGRRHEAFASEYVRDHNGTRAYRAIYKSVKSDDVAGAAAARLLATVKVRRMVDRLEAAAGARVNVSIDELLRTSVALAHVDPVDLFNADGSLRPIQEIPRHARLAIVGLDISEEYAGVGKKRRLVSRHMKPRLLDKNSALERLFKYKGMFSKDNEQKADVIRQFMEAVSGRSRGLPGSDTEKP